VKPAIRSLVRPLGTALLVLMAGLTGADGSLAQNQKLKAVDVELVLAVDISQSMDEDEHTLQRMGYVEAFRHKDVINALLSGPEGRIAVTYMEWGGTYDPYTLIPWTIIDSGKAANAFADKLADEPITSEQRTSISNALIGAVRLIEGNDIASHRRVIDVSGDGANNSGPPVEDTRDQVLKRDITINGLPIVLNKPKQYYDIDHLDRYYKHCVIGGPGAFIAPVFSLQQLSATIRKKLVLEIAGLEADPAPQPGSPPVQFADAAPGPGDSPTLSRVQLKIPAEKTDCFAGEKAMGGGGRGFDRFRDQ
jgi:hypothetical protein